MLKRTEKQVDNAQGKTQHEMHRSKCHKVTQSERPPYNNVDSHNVCLTQSVWHRENTKIKLINTIKLRRALLLYLINTEPELEKTIS